MHTAIIWLLISVADHLNAQPGNQIWWARPGRSAGLSGTFYGRGGSRPSLRESSPPDGRHPLAEMIRIDAAPTDTLIIDEAPSSNLNIISSWGTAPYLPARPPDLKNVISPTIDSDRFARTFRHTGGEISAEHLVGTPAITRKCRTPPIQWRCYLQPLVPRRPSVAVEGHHPPPPGGGQEGPTSGSGRSPSRG